MAQSPNPFKKEISTSDEKKRPAKNRKLLYKENGFLSVVKIDTAKINDNEQ